jgi:hypothetical protein
VIGGAGSSRRREEAAPRARPRQARLAILLLVGATMLSGGREVYRAVDLWRLPGHDADLVTAADARFAALRQALPAHGVVGYVSEPTHDADTRFHLAQHALAPLVLARGVDHEVVVSDFSASGTVAEALARERFRVVRDFGRGVLLLRPAR